MLSIPGPIDVFAPNNAAFAALLESLGASPEQLLEQTELVTRVLKLHVVTDGAVCDGDLSGTVPTALAGESLTVDGDRVCAGDSCANIVASVSGGNGVVYIIDSVLLPTPDAGPAPAPAPSAY